MAFASTLDITDLKQAQAALARQATHDPLTGLPNRRLLIGALMDALEDLGRGHRTGTVALMFVDLDRFKLVNDTLALCDLPTACVANTPSSFSIGRIKISKQSRNNALALDTTADTSWLTSVPFRLSRSRIRNSPALCWGGSRS
jgi:hypothetical protein